MSDSIKIISKRFIEVKIERTNRDDPIGYTVFEFINASHIIRIKFIEHEIRIYLEGEYYIGMYFDTEQQRLDIYTKLCEFMVDSAT